MTDERRSGAAKVVLFAALGGALVGFAAVYGISGLEGNRVAAKTCPADRGQLAALRPLAKGELAAMVVRDSPQPLPDMNFVDAQGRKHTLDEWRGQTVLLNLWATWCAPCREEMPALDRLAKSLEGEPIKIATVSIDRDPEVAKAFLKEIDVPNLPYYGDADGKIFHELKKLGKAFGMPTTLLINGDGCELANIAGPAEWDSKDAKDFIRAAIGKVTSTSLDEGGGSETPSRVAEFR